MLLVNRCVLSTVWREAEREAWGLPIDCAPTLGTVLDLPNAEVQW